MLEVGNCESFVSSCKIQESTLGTIVKSLAKDNSTQTGTFTPIIH